MQVCRLADAFPKNKPKHRYNKSWLVLPDLFRETRSGPEVEVKKKNQKWHAEKCCWSAVEKDSSFVRRSFSY